MGETPTILISVVVPVYTDSPSLRTLLDRIETVPIPKQVVIVHDGSSDAARQVAAALEGRAGDRTVAQSREKGKGAALVEGFRHVTGDIVIVQDANLEYEPTEYPRLVAPILENRADVVYGSRFAGGDSRRVLYFWHSMGNRLLTLVSNMLTNLNLTDMETGYKVFRREVLEHLPLQSRGYGIDPEVTVKLARANYRIFEVSICYSGRTEEGGMRTGWTDAVEAFWLMIRFRFLDRTPLERVALPPLSAGTWTTAEDTATPGQGA